jgi:hypothetical protein
MKHSLIPEDYGEIFPNDFMNFMHRYIRNIPFPYMIDVGSGFGILAEYVSKHGIFRVDGIEMDRYRYERSIQSKKYDTVYLHGCFTNISFENYNILYSCTLFWKKGDANRFYDKIKQEFKGLCVLYEKPEQLKDYFHKKYVVKTTWNLEQTIYLIFM